MPRVGIQNILVLDDKSFIAKGFYQGKLSLSDSINESEFGFFLIHFVNNKPKEVLSLKDVGGCEVYQGQDNFFFVTGYKGDAFKSQFIACYNDKFQLLWEKTFELLVPERNSLIVNCDAIIDDKKKLFVLFNLKNGRIRINNEVIEGTGEVLVKFNSQGLIEAFKKISDSEKRFVKLKIISNKLFALGHKESVELGINLSSIPTNLLLKSVDIASEKYIFTLRGVGSRPKKVYHVQKFDSMGNVISDKEVFRDTVRFYGSIHQTAILDYNKRQLLIIYVSDGDKVKNIRGIDISILILDKSNLNLSKRFTLHCNSFLKNETGFSENVLFKLRGNNLLIAYDYPKKAVLGDIILEGNTTGPDWARSFFITELNLK
jgi:hypothetical protein